jgi:hypothetical protein
VAYGTLTAGAAGGAGPHEAASLGEEMLQVTLRCVAASAGERSDATKRLPGSLTVVQLKALCESLFKVSPRLPASPWCSSRRCARACSR